MSECEAIKPRHKNNKQVEKFCLICNSSIFVKKSHAEKEGKYCSKICMSAGYKIRMLSENNPNYKGGITFNKEYYNARLREYYKKNPDVRRQNNRVIKAKRKSLEGFYTNKDVAWKLLIQKNKCYWCYEELNMIYHIDHVIPVSRGGSNWPENIVPSCPACNLQKRNMMPEEWFLKPNCRAIRRIYEAGRYSEGFGG